MTPTAVAGHFNFSRQAVSKHIQVLVVCKLIKSEQTQGREIYYHFNPKKMKEIADWIDPFRQLWEERLDRLEHVLNNLKNKKS